MKTPPHTPEFTRSTAAVRDIPKVSQHESIRVVQRMVFWLRGCWVGTSVGKGTRSRAH